MMRTVLAIVASAFLLASCGEKEQAVQGSYNPDQKAWQSNATPYNAANFKGNDRAAWEDQMRNRIQVQNEYVRIN